MRIKIEKSDGSIISIESNIEMEKTIKIIKDFIKDSELENKQFIDEDALKWAESGDIYEERV